MSETQWNPHKNWRPVIPFRELIKQPDIKEILYGDGHDDTVAKINRQIERIYPNSGASFTREEYDLARKTAVHFTRVQQGDNDPSSRNFHREAVVTLYPAAFEGKVAINLSSERLGKVTATSSHFQREFRSSDQWLTCQVSRALEMRNQREGIEFRKEHTFSRSDKKFLEIFNDEADGRFSQAVRHAITQKDAVRAGINSPQQSLPFVAQRGVSGARKAQWEDQVFGNASERSKATIAC